MASTDSAPPSDDHLTRVSQHLSELLDSVSDGVFFVDEDGRVSYANASASRILGVSEADLIGRNSAELGISETLPCRVAGKSRRAPDPTEYGEPGSEQGRPVRTVAVPDAGGVLLTMPDRRELAELEDRLRRTQRVNSVGRLVASVAHDFNNILTVVLGQAQLLQLAEFEGIECEPRESLEAILGAADRGIELTGRLLAYCGGRAHGDGPADANDVVRELTRFVRPLLEESIELCVELAPGAPRVGMEAGPLEQVIMNLVINARDAMPEGGMISLFTRVQPASDVGRGAEDGEPEGRIVIEVSDQGSGISPEAMSRIFHPFFTTKRPGEGTGLGLSTVRRIVEESGGEIEVDSTPGEGSVFRVSIPLSPDEEGRTER